MAIKKVVGDADVWLSAKDVFEELGLSWKGHSSIKTLDIKDAKVAKVPTKVGTRTCKLNQIVLSKRGIEKVCTEHKISLRRAKAILDSVTVMATSDTQKSDLEKLQKQVNDLKVVVAQLLTTGKTPKNSLYLTGKSSSIRNDRSQALARKEVRKVVEAYAKKRADELKINDPQRRSVFYDLTYKSLYTEYKSRTPKHIDLKALAEQKTQTTGIKTSALQVAEQLGIANELLNLANSLFGKQ